MVDRCALIKIVSLPMEMAGHNIKKYQKKQVTAVCRGSKLCPA